MMKILFCSDPLNPRQADDAYSREAARANEIDLPFALVDYESLVSNEEPERAVRRVVAEALEIMGIYRGWMLRPRQYQELYAGLLSKGIRLINDTAAYRHCHYLPESYSLIEPFTPKTVWVACGHDVPMDEVMQRLLPFGSSPIIVKDYVKSRKHEWEEACFIPSASDRSTVERIVKQFIELQDDDFCEGLVFREFVDFEPLSHHSKSGMPLTKEFRLFFLDGKLAYWTEYWEEGDYQGLLPPVDQFTQVAMTIQSRFFTMDIAKRKNGDWMIVELGDAQVAGLPDNADVGKFYGALKSLHVAEYHDKR